MAKFRIECDGEKTKIWIGDEEIGKTVERVTFTQSADGPPRVDLTFYPVDLACFTNVRKDGKNE